MVSCRSQPGFQVATLVEDKLHHLEDSANDQHGEESFDSAGCEFAAGMLNDASSAVSFCRVAHHLLHMSTRADSSEIVARLLQEYPPCREVFADLILSLPAESLAEFSTNTFAMDTVASLFQAFKDDDGESVRAFRKICRMLEILGKQHPESVMPTLPMTASALSASHSSRSCTRPNTGVLTPSLGCVVSPKARAELLPSTAAARFGGAATATTVAPPPDGFTGRQSFQSHPLCAEYGTETKAATPPAIAVGHSVASSFQSAPRADATSAATLPPSPQPYLSWSDAWWSEPPSWTKLPPRELLNVSEKPRAICHTAALPFATVRSQTTSTGSVLQESRTPRWKAPPPMAPAKAAPFETAGKLLAADTAAFPPAAPDAPDLAANSASCDGRKSVSVEQQAAVARSLSNYLSQTTFAQSYSDVLTGLEDSSQKGKLYFADIETGTHCAISFAQVQDCAKIAAAPSPGESPILCAVENCAGCMTRSGCNSGRCNCH